MMITGEGWHTRPVQPDDARFVLDSFAQSLGPGFYKRFRRPAMSNRDATFGERQIAERLLSESGVSMIVSDDEPIAMGWAVADPELSTLHFLYVRRTFRRMGIGRRVLEALHREAESRLTIASHWNTHFEQLCAATGATMRYDPYRAILPRALYLERINRAQRHDSVSSRSRSLYPAGSEGQAGAEASGGTAA